jgi:hypothetical protein
MTQLNAAVRLAADAKADKPLQVSAALSDGLNPKQKANVEDILTNWENSSDEEVLTALIVDLKIPQATAQKLVAMRDKFMNFMPTKAKPRLDW